MQAAAAASDGTQNRKGLNMFGQNRDTLRQFYVEAWRKRREGLPMEPLETLVAQVVAEHPEYQRLLESADEALGREYLPEFGETNPFLHMGLHLALREQVSTQRPAGVGDIYRTMLTRHGDAHAAEHAMMDCLVESIWQAQRSGGAPDEAAYLRCLQQLNQKK